ncbi:MAG: RNA 2',3'-cyclic phosphodiesterase [Candidatus Kerfeldbacteria bacterium]
MGKQKLRLFCSIPLPQEVSSVLAGIQKMNGKIGGIRWTRKANMHITVRFFGAVQNEDIPNLIDALQQVTDSIPPFELAFNAFQLGPPGRRPRMVWALFNLNPVYRQLVEDIDSVVGEQICMKESNHQPIPHVTLARFDNASIADVLRIPDTPEGKMGIQVDVVDLMESIYAGDTPVYETIKHYALKG